MTNYSERYKKGLQIASDAISNRDPDLLGRCLMQFRKINTPPEILLKALAQCPLSLVRDAKIAVKIYSETLQKEIILGHDISFEEIMLLMESRPDKETLKEIIEIKTMFSGEIVEIHKKKPEEITEEDLEDF